MRRSFAPRDKGAKLIYNVACRSARIQRAREEVAAMVEVNRARRGGGSVDHKQRRSLHLREVDGGRRPRVLASAIKGDGGAADQIIAIDHLVGQDRRACPGHKPRHIRIVGAECGAPPTRVASSAEVAAVDSTARKLDRSGFGARAGA